MQVVVLDRGRHLACAQLRAELKESGRERSQYSCFIGWQRQVALDQPVVPGGQRPNAKVGHVVLQVLERMRGLAALELGVKRQGREQRFGRIVRPPDGRAGIGEQKPGAIVIMSEHVGHTARPAGAQLGSQPGLKCLDRRASLEPD